MACSFSASFCGSTMPSRSRHTVVASFTTYTPHPLGASCPSFNTCTAPSPHLCLADPHGRSALTNPDCPFLHVFFPYIHDLVRDPLRTTKLSLWLLSALVLSARYNDSSHLVPPSGLFWWRSGAKDNIGCSTCLIPYCNRITMQQQIFWRSSYWCAEWCPTAQPSAAETHSSTADLICSRFSLSRQCHPTKCC